MVDAALREVREETGLQVGGRRRRSATSPTGTRGATRTARRVRVFKRVRFFLLRYRGGRFARPRRRARRVRWFPLERRGGRDRLRQRAGARAPRSRAARRRERGAMTMELAAGLRVVLRAEPRADDRVPARISTSSARATRSRSTSRRSTTRTAAGSRPRTSRSHGWCSPTSIPTTSAARSTSAVPIAVHRSRAAFAPGGRPLAPATPLEDGDEIPVAGRAPRRRAHARARVRALLPLRARAPLALHRRYGALDRHDHHRTARRRHGGVPRVAATAPGARRRDDLPRATVRPSRSRRRCSTSTSHTACCASGRSSTRLRDGPAEIAALVARIYVGLHPGAGLGGGAHRAGAPDEARARGAGGGGGRRSLPAGVTPRAPPAVRGWPRPAQRQHPLAAALDGRGRGPTCVCRRANSTASRSLSHAVIQATTRSVPRANATSRSPSQPSAIDAPLLGRQHAAHEEAPHHQLAQRVGEHELVSRTARARGVSGGPRSARLVPRRRKVALGMEDLRRTTSAGRACARSTASQPPHASSRSTKIAARPGTGTPATSRSSAGTSGTDVASSAGRASSWCRTRARVASSEPATSDGRERLPRSRRPRASARRARTLIAVRRRRRLRCRSEVPSTGPAARG